MKILEKLQKRLQEGKKDNKGFSLVELIIVIAIMAILIGIVGMNIIPQIENARQSKDKQVLSAYLTESVQALTQNAALCTSQKFKITVTVGSGKTTKVECVTNDVADAEGAKAILKSFASLAGFTLKDDGTIETGATTFESNAGKDLSTITILLSLKTSEDAAKLTTAGSSDAANNLATGNDFTSK